MELPVAFLLSAVLALSASVQVVFLMSAKGILVSFCAPATAICQKFPGRRRTLTVSATLSVKTGDAAYAVN